MTRYTRFPPVQSRATLVEAIRPDPTGVRPGSFGSKPEPRPAPRQDRTSGRNSTPPLNQERLNPVVLLFILSLIVPVYFYLGSIRISPTRLVTLLAFGPLMASWMTGGCGRIRAADLLVITFAVWMMVTFLADSGASSPEYAVMSSIETVTPYFIARRYMRTEAQYATLVRLLLWIAVLLLPAAVAESFTGRRLYNTLFSFLPTHPWANYEPRWGMFRAQTVFEHPILFGVFSAFLFSPVYAWARSVASVKSALLRSLPVVGCTFFSLSAGAYMGLNIQGFLLLWGFTLQRITWRWKFLAALTVLGYVVVDLGSSRTPFQVFSTYLAFDPQTAYYRVLILRYGLENMWQHPILGMGLNDWVRPDFMYSASVDNFWLLQAMRHGIPGFLMMFGIYLLCLRQLVVARVASVAARRHREALAFSLIGLGLSIVTVHIWGATYALFMFMLGATTVFGTAQEKAGAGLHAEAEALSGAGASPGVVPNQKG